MFTQAFQDLLKPQWLATLSELKTSGGAAVSELSGVLDSSYMTIKQHCEDLTKLGYLQRTRLPRTEIGRPQIFYRLTEKSEALFPAIPPSFTLEILEQVKQLFGENAPERLLFQYFQNQEKEWTERLSKGTTILYKAQLFAKLREKEGLFVRCTHNPETGIITLREYHHPLRCIFEIYPRAIALEQRAIEAALGVKITRQTPDAPDGAPGYVDLILLLA